MAARSEAWPAVATWGHLRATPAPAAPARAGHAPDAACRQLHTYLPDGTQLCWRHTLPGTFAVDAELASAAVPPSLAARWPGPPADFWRAWVTAEVVAKLTNTPVLPLVSAAFPVPSDPRVDTVLATHDDVVVCFGRLRLAP